jgi:hypothetical protein
MSSDFAFVSNHQIGRESMATTKNVRLLQNRIGGDFTVKVIEDDEGRIYRVKLNSEGKVVSIKLKVEHWREIYQGKHGDIGPKNQNIIEIAEQASKLERSP